MIGSELLRFNKDQKYMTLDKETSGLNLISALPTQVSWVTYTLKENLETHDHYVYWPEEELRMSKGAARVTRFNFAEYKEKAEDPRKVLEKFEDYIFSPSYKLANHNLYSYDSLILNSWRRKLGLKPRFDYLLGRSYDTLALSKALRLGLKPDLSSDINFLAWQYRVCDIITKQRNFTTIGAMCKFFNIEMDESLLHNAKFDIIQNREIFRKLIWAMEI